jgi:hypothetical protein
MSGTTRNLRDAEIWVKDGSPTPKTMMLPLTEGDLSFTEKDNSFIVMNRGKIDSRKQGDESVLDLNFTAKFEQWQYAYGATGLSPVDVMCGKAAAIAAGWVNTDTCGPYAVTIEFRIYDPCNRANYELLAFNKVHFNERAFKEGSEYNTIAFKGDALQGSVDSTYVTP